MTHWEITSIVTQLWDVLVFWGATALRMLLSFNYLITLERQDFDSEMSLIDFDNPPWKVFSISLNFLKASTARPASYLFLYEPYGVLRVSLLCLFDLRDGVGPHPPQRVFGLVAELFGQLGEVLPVFPRHSAEVTWPPIRLEPNGDQWKDYTEHWSVSDWCLRDRYKWWWLVSGLGRSMSLDLMLVLSQFWTFYAGKRHRPAILDPPRTTKRTLLHIRIERTGLQNARLLDSTSGTTWRHEVYSD